MKKIQEKLERTAADFMKKWFLKQTHMQEKKIYFVTYISLPSNIKQNRLSR